ncbi:MULTISPECIES: NUDIX hydrolase [Streptomyces]|uniref:NUDIX hydrolase n=1 Tax=Streptomyces qinglanensis TaxID=943816 RepID=A0A1E7K929_9ACTN|nr:MULTISPECIES: NUDIX hydrolase [Streptomyces]OEV00431.1 NUDIX hydrolase [Streptomyces qinglanensis]OEV24039.1 NUDIX hydrolase [Streptomyces nanshensis]
MSASPDGLHADAERVLTRWRSQDGDPAQEELREEYLRHLADRPDGMWKACSAGHITASAMVVDPRKNRVLLTLHRKLGRWLQMGGHCEPEDTTLAGAALREATEESGIPGLSLLPGGPLRLDRHRTPCAWHLDVQYAALAPEGAVAAISEESLDLRWFGFEEVAGVEDESVVRLARLSAAAVAVSPGRGPLP